MAKYGKKASEKVKRAMHERKKGKLKSGRIGQEGEKPQTGDCDWVVGGPARGSQSAPQEVCVEEEVAPGAERISLRLSLTNALSF